MADNDHHVGALRPSMLVVTTISTGTTKPFGGETRSQAMTPPANHTSKTLRSAPHRRPDKPAFWRRIDEHAHDFPQVPEATRSCRPLT